MKLRTFLKHSALVASLLLATTFQVAAQAPAEGRPGGGNRGGGLLTADQSAKMRETIQGEMAPLTAKLAEAEKAVAAAALDTSVSEADFKAKVATLQKIQADIAVVRLKGVRAIAPTLTDEQKTRLSGSPNGGYMMLFGGYGGGGRGMGGRTGGQGPQGGQGAATAR